MRLVGWCTGCHKIRSVRVTGQGMTMLASRAGVAQGVCADCERKEDEKRVERQGRRR